MQNLYKELRYEIQQLNVAVGHLHIYSIYTQ